MPDGQSLQFDLSPKGLPVMESLELSVTGLGELKNPLKIWFEGKSMYMGMHYMLQSATKSQFPGQKIFQGIIPVCSVDQEMVWLLNVDVPYKNQMLNIQFRMKPITGA